MFVVYEYTVMSCGMHCLLSCDDEATDVIMYPYIATFYIKVLFEVRIFSYIIFVYARICVCKNGESVVSAKR